MGTEKPFVGRLRISSELRLRQENYGRPELGAERRLSDQRLVTGVAYAMRPWLFLSASVPVVRRTLQYPNLAQDEVMHMGDADATAKFFLWQDRAFRPKHLAGATVGLTAPTAVRQRHPDGNWMDIDVQPGFGAWVPSAGLWYSHFRFPWSLHVSSTVHVPTPGWSGLHAGVSWLNTVSAQYQPTTWLGAGLSADARTGQRDTYSGVVDPNSGGTIVYLSPSVLISPWTDVIVHATVRVPVVDALFGVHDEGTIFVGGLTFDL